MNLIEMPETWFMALAILAAIVYWFRVPKMRNHMIFFRILVPIFCLWTSIVLHPMLRDRDFVIFLGSLVIILAIALLMLDYFLELFEEFQRPASEEERIAKSLPTHLLETCTALGYLASRGIGALVVIERRDKLKDKVDGGMPFDAEVKAEVLTALFAKESPVHDGAVILVRGRIKRVKTILPLRTKVILPMGTGTRHRAAVGITEKADAIALVSSEERGEVSVAYRGALVKAESENDFLTLVRDAYQGRSINR